LQKKAKVLSDDPLTQSQKAALDFPKYSNKLANLIRNSPPTFSVGIFGEWGTGKTQLMKMIEAELKTDPKIITVWFNAWKYEREEYLAVVPLLRTISLAIESGENIKDIKWKGVQAGFKRALYAFLASTKFKVGFESIASIEVNCKEMIDKYKDPEQAQSGENIYLHANEFIIEALRKLRENKRESEFRIVIFVDDLDRCLPINALDVLESIKSFFDIEGVIFVIGMSPQSIDSLIRKKRFQNPNIGALDYLEKIVQLPFHIPAWSIEDITYFVNDIVRQEIKSYIEFNENTLKLIAFAVKKSPRDVKRFINSIILAKEILNEPATDMLIAVHALKFRTEWNHFLDYMMDDVRRQQFLTKYLEFIKGNQIAAAFVKELEKECPDLLKSYPDLLSNPDSDLRKFLDIGGAGKILLDIDNMERFRRALDPFDIRKFFGERKIIYDGVLSSSTLPNEYLNPEQGIKIRYPANWDEREGSGEILVSFSPPQRSGKHFEEIGNFVVRLKRNYNSLEEAVRDIREERKRVSQEGKFHIEEERSIQLSDNPAYIMKMRRTPRYPPIIPIKAIMCIITKQNNTYILGYSQHEKKYFDYVPPVEKMIESFEITK
jgi:KAP-like P-loop domain-containing protein